MKKFTTEEIRDLFNRVMREEISFSEMVEVMNERAGAVSEPKFKKGDRVRIKEGISSKTHRYITPGFIVQMDDLIGKELTVDRYANGMVYTEESYCFHEDWLEPYTDKLKKGDLAIFWIFDKTQAAVRLFDKEQGDIFQLPIYVDNTGHWWANAIKFESKEQFERFIKREI